ncbi:MAG: hypothetical protein OJF55_000944 [Rhodanobacteraceae bacterium]|jgi:cytochrome b561|nr:MAG: hypothetical protein OJF55_000944 [Rhodanobacteraceae bacterium]
MSDPHYSPWLRRLHWLIFILVACALLLIYLHGWLPKSSALRARAKWAHMQFGIAILLIMLPRLLVRARDTAPPITPVPPLWQTLVARTTHLALYALLFATPLLGVATMAWSGQHWNFLGLPLPSVPTPDRHFSHQLEDIHETFGNVLMYLAAAHALAALLHHFIQRDDTLKRMLPPSRDSA